MFTKDICLGCSILIARTVSRTSQCRKRGHAVMSRNIYERQHNSPIRVATPQDEQRQRRP